MPNLFRCRCLAWTCAVTAFAVYLLFKGKDQISKSAFNKHWKHNRPDAVSDDLGSDIQLGEGYPLDRDYQRNVSSYMHKYRETYTAVLLLSYLRSGSSITGNILQQAAGTFYIYEPFKPFLKHSYYRHGSTICFINNTCRAAKSLIESDKFAVYTLKSLFACDFKTIHSQVWTSILRTAHVSFSHKKYQRCLDLTQNESFCMEAMSKRCLTSPVRIVKTIRLSMELLEHLMVIIPNLKVIHLVRDPRGITKSRLEGGHLKHIRFSDHANDTCSRMVRDLQIGLTLHEKYTNQTTIMVYEALAETPLKAAEFLYRFLDLELTDNISKWIYLNTQAGAKNSGYYETRRSNSSAIAYNWRQKLSFADIQILDSKCSQLYEIVGYSLVSTKDQLRHSTRTRGTIVYGFTQTK